MASTSVSCWKIYTLSQHQFVGLMVDRTEASLKVKINNEIAKRVSSESVEKRLLSLLNEEPRNWLVLKAVKETADEFSLFLSPDILDQYEQLKKQDCSLLVRTRQCLQCARDAAKCSLSAILLCRGPIDLSPLGDLATLIREVSKYLRGEKIDKIDTTLSALGLGSIVLGPPKGAPVKLGASTAKAAKRMGLLSRGMMKMTEEAFDSIDWSATVRSKSFTDLGKSVRSKGVMKLEETLSHLGSIYRQQGSLHTMYLAKHIDNAEDARKLERITRVQGKSTIGKIELLGKSRLLKMTMRYSSEAWTLLVGIIGMLGSIIGLFWSLFSSMFVGLVRKTLKKKIHKTDKL